mmetsp:Transcript_17081/g.36082  ORF Transcript_17081/g.36082 Transcript_17081/m.36082 type:complete len:238 (+) Transcript_17081:1801-2514(+)
MEAKDAVCLVRLPVFSPRAIRHHGEDTTALHPLPQAKRREEARLLLWPDCEPPAPLHRLLGGGRDPALGIPDLLPASRICPPVPLHRLRSARPSQRQVTQQRRRLQKHPGLRAAGALHRERWRELAEISPRPDRSYEDLHARRCPESSRTSTPSGDWPCRVGCPTLCPILLGQEIARDNALPFRRCCCHQDRPREERCEDRGEEAVRAAGRMERHVRHFPNGRQTTRANCSSGGRGG